MPPLTEFARDAGLLALASFLGSLVGWQREAQARPAGLRTHILVALGSCLLTLIRFPGGDTARIAAQIVTGIGFLGAGVILRRGAAVRGLTTAASIWVVAGIGIAVGAGGVYAGLAAVATLIVLITLEAGNRVEHWIRKTTREATLLITVPRAPGATSQALAAITSAGAAILSFEQEGDGRGLLPGAGEPDLADRRSLIVTIRMDSNVTADALTEALAETLPGIQVVWT